jgi:hypothetical protein
MLDLDQESTDRFIRDIDSMARAAYVWVRQQSFEQRFIGIYVSSAEETALAAGFLAGLRSRLRLGDSESTLVAYVYTVMVGQQAGAPRVAEALVNREPGSFASCAGYLEGLRAARQILGEHRHEPQVRALMC